MSSKGLEPRERAILAEIIEYYFAHHEAVSARTLSKISDLALSPTTIRNLMEDLSEAGYLSHQGAARGRLPTQKAFHIYITRLHRGPRAAAPPEAAALEPPRELESLDARLSRLGRLLVEQTGFAAGCLLPPREAYPLDWVRFAAVADDRVLVSVGTPFGDVWSRLVPTAEPIAPEILADLERFLSREFRGHTLAEARSGIMTGRPLALLEEASSLGAAFRTLRRAFEWGDAAQWRTWGEATLLRVPEFQQPETLVALHDALADPLLLPRAAERGRQVYGALLAIGSETGLPGLETLSLVAHPFGPGDAWRGHIAVIGPMHMDYGKVLQVTAWAAKTLSRGLAGGKQRPSRPTGTP